jgi:hypothetical protein
MTGSQKRSDGIVGDVSFNVSAELTVIKLLRFRNTGQIISSPYKRDSNTAKFFCQKQRMK